MAHDHQQDISKLPETRLTIAFALTAGFMLVEVLGGWLTGSLALISDAMHMLTDSIALLLALIAIYAGRKAADVLRTYGYARFEVLAAAANALILLAVAIYILYAAIKRIGVDSDIQTLGMLLVAVAGLIVNLVSMRLLSKAKDESLNVKGAYLEVWADMLGSLAVIIGAIIIWNTGWQWVDSVLAVLIGFMVFPRTWVLLKDCLNLLLEGVPSNMNVQAIEQLIAETEGVASLHDLHLWALTQNKPMLTAHVVLKEGFDSDTVRLAIEQQLSQSFARLKHTTLQMEHVDNSANEHLH